MSKYDSIIKTSQYFPKPYEPYGADINVKVDLSNYGTKTDIKNIRRVNTSTFALKSATTSALTAVEHKIPNVSNSVKKADYDTKVN